MMWGKALGFMPYAHIMLVFQIIYASFLVASRSRSTDAYDPEKPTSDDEVSCKFDWGFFFFLIKV